MTGRSLVLVLSLLAVSVGAQVGGGGKADVAPAAQREDELLKRIAAAENYQRSMDLGNAAVENRAVLAIALERAGLVAIEEGEYDEAIGHLRQSLVFADTANGRTNLAIALMRKGLFDEALGQARAALTIDTEHVGARYILANILYTQEDYEAALPALERVFATSPDFEIARALGFTYLSLKKIDEARAHFEKTLGMLKNADAGIHVLFAKFYERTNYPADAERELKRAIALDPKASRVNLYLGYLLMQHGGSGRLGEALTWFEKEMKLSPDDFYPVFYAGVAASSDNEHDKAIPLLKRAIELNPESGEAYLFLGQSQLALEDLENAEKNLRKAVTLEENGGKNTQSRRTHFLLGRLLVRTGRREEGRKELELANKLQQEALDSSRDNLDKILSQVTDDNQNFNEPFTQPERPQLKPERIEQLSKIKEFLKGVIAQSYANLGVIATQRSDLPEAVKSFSTAYEWDPDFPGLGRNLGIVRFRYADYEGAIGPLAAHLKANPSDALARKLLGSSCYFTNRYPEAVDALKPIEQTIAADAELAYFYGLSLVRVKRQREAVAVFERISAVHSGNAEVLLNAAQGFMIAGEYARAVTEFEKVLRLAPATRKANYYIGQSNLRLNRPANAEAAFEKELQLDPNDALSKYHLALTLIEGRKDRERAVALLQDAARIRPGYADAHYQLGKIYIEKGENAKAIEELERAVAADAEKDYIHYQLSIAYRKASRLKDAERALEVYKKLKEEKRNTDVPMAMGDEMGPPEIVQ